MIFQLIEFIDVTVLVTEGTLFVTGPYPTPNDNHFAVGVMSVDTVGEPRSAGNFSP
jgi:hypothetical protein